MDERHEAGQPACAIQRAPLNWTQVNWIQVKRRAESLQRKIFRDTRAGNFRAASQNQKLLARLQVARLWAVKLTTEVNRGSNTPGIDGRL